MPMSTHAKRAYNPATPRGVRPRLSNVGNPLSGIFTPGGTTKELAEFDEMARG